MGKYHLTTELFQLPEESEHSILYAPLIGFACYANSGLIALLTELEARNDSQFTEAELKILNYLISRGVINGTEHAPLQPEQSDEFLPSSLALFLTNRCNLRCGYCYAAEDQSRTKTMSWNIAKSAIDFFIQSMQQAGRTIFPLEFHGGGEPFCAFALMQKVVAYAQHQCHANSYKLELTAATNGMLNRKKLEWVVQNFSSLIVSYEGIPSVQNLQRPRVEGRDSFPMIDRALCFLDRHKFPYSIRTTLTAHNQNRLEETLDFIASRYACRTWIVEPMQECGFGKTQANLALPDLQQFAQQFIPLSEQAQAKGRKLEYSGAQLERRTSTFCHVGTDEIAVTPDGYFTNCWEVSHVDHPQAERFIFGSILADGKAQVDESKRKALRSCCVQNFPLCQDCFAKYHCAGGCILRMEHLAGKAAADTLFCRTTREILLQKIKRLLV